MVEKNRFEENNPEKIKARPASKTKSEKCIMDCKKNFLSENEKEFHKSRNIYGYSDNSWNDPFLPKSRNPNITDSFLNNCRHNKTPLAFYLLNNKTDRGIIVGFDNQSIVVYNQKSTQFLIMRSGIIKIVPDDDVNYIFSNIYTPDNRPDGKNGNKKPSPINQNDHVSCYHSDKFDYQV